MFRIFLVSFLMIGTALCFAGSDESLEEQFNSLEAKVGTVDSRRLKALKDLDENFFGKYQKNIVLEEPEMKIESLRDEEATIRLIFNWHLEKGVVDELMGTLSKYFNATNSKADPEFYAHMNYAKDEHTDNHDSLESFMKSRGLGLRVRFMGRVEDLYIFSLPGIYPKGQKMWIDLDVDRKDIKGNPPVKVKVQQYDSVPCSGVACWEDSWRLRQ